MRLIFRTLLVFVDLKGKGKIEVVDPKEPSLVQISLGSDQGISTNNTLYAYRLRPDVKYLGEIRVVDVYPNRSVGRLETPPGAVRHGIRGARCSWAGTAGVARLA